jgi:hypothetical protein
MTFQCGAIACVPTCSDKNAATNCQLPKADACVCPEGQVVNNGVCIPESECPRGCTDSHQQLREVKRYYIEMRV